MTNTVTFTSFAPTGRRHISSSSLQRTRSCTPHSTDATPVTMSEWAANAVTIHGRCPRMMKIIAHWISRVGIPEGTTINPCLTRIRDFRSFPHHAQCSCANTPTTCLLLTNLSHQTTRRSVVHYNHHLPLLHSSPPPPRQPPLYLPNRSPHTHTLKLPLYTPHNPQHILQPHSSLNSTHHPLQPPYRAPQPLNQPILRALQLPQYQLTHAHNPLIPLGECCAEYKARGKPRDPRIVKYLNLRGHVRA